MRCLLQNILWLTKNMKEGLEQAHCLQLVGFFVTHLPLLIGVSADQSWVIPPREHSLFTISFDLLTLLFNHYFFFSDKHATREHVLSSHIPPVLFLPRTPAYNIYYNENSLRFKMYSIRRMPKLRYIKV